MGLTPQFKLIANGQDVTEHIAKNLISISFHDEDELKSDKIDIKVFGDFKRPKYKDELKLYLSYKEEESEFFCGTFVVQNTVWNIDNTISISATATDFSSDLKVIKNRSFENITIMQIVQYIANLHNLKYKCDFDDISIPYIAQNHESDISFLLRIAKEYNAVYAIKNGYVIFLRLDEKSNLKTVTINTKDCAGLNITNSNKTYYRSVSLKYQDTRKNIVKEVQVGDEKPTYYMNETFSNIDLLVYKANAKLQRLNKGVKSGSFSTVGFPIYARSNLNFLNIKKEDDITYHINTITHTIGENGWNMSVEFSN